MSIARKSTPKPAAAVVTAPVVAAPVAKPAAPVQAGPAALDVAAKSAEPKAAAATPVAPETLLKPLADFQETMRATTEKSLEQFRSQYASLKGTADTASDKLEESFQAAQAGSRAFNSKLFDLVRSQSDASLKHVQALFAAKTLNDALNLQKSFIETQVEALQAQSKDFAALAQKMASDVVEPVKDSVVVAFKR